MKCPGDHTHEWLETVLAAHALHINETRSHHETELAALVHHGEHVAHAERHIKDFIEALITDSANNGSVRNDASPSDLTEFCIHVTSAAQDLASKAAVQRLVSVTLGALQPLASHHG